jgi:ADP-ribose pyrophosphatase YjhB (NUDIX family)
MIGVGPLGGSIEFGETAQAAVIRELEERLSITVQTAGPPVFMENLFTHEGEPGHEILAIFDVLFPPSVLVANNRIEFHEGNGVQYFAAWFDLVELDLSNQRQFFQKGLKALLQRQFGNGVRACGEILRGQADQRRLCGPLSFLRDPAGTALATAPKPREHS